MSRNDIQKIVITGASGFLGSNLVYALKEKKGYFVYGLTSDAEKLKMNNICRNVHYYGRESIFSFYGKHILEDAIVVNCAFPRNSSGTNLAGGLRYIQLLFERAKECGVKGVINVSSQSVYSQTRKGPATEDTPVCLENQYAVGKYATELMLESICKNSCIAYTNLRMASLIGPGFDLRIVNRLLKQAIEGKTLYVIKSNQKFGFLDIEDGVRAILMLCNIDVAQWKQLYNIGNGMEYSIEYIVNCIRYLFEKNELKMPEVQVKSENIYGNTGVAYYRLHKDTGFEPSVKIDTSIQRILDWLKEHSR